MRIAGLSDSANTLFNLNDARKLDAALPCCSRFALESSGSELAAPDLLSLTRRDSSGTLREDSAED